MNQVETRWESLMGKTDLTSFFVSSLKKRPKLVKLIKNIAYQIAPDTVLLLEYPISPRQRWNVENPHQKLYEIINGNREIYKTNLEQFLTLANNFRIIQKSVDQDLREPCWRNYWIPALDSVSLYGLIAIHRPEIYLEIGSGYSTKFARKAIIDQNLNTKIISIDPCPRCEIDSICDEVIRRPVEEIDLEIFDQLRENSILYIDNSHRVFMNSDVTTMFLDVFPRLKPGVIVQIHDIALPYDYPTEWINRYYSEQYLLAAYLLAQGDMFDIILPNMFINHDQDLKGILNPLWEMEELANVDTGGSSFWIRMK